MCIAQEFDEHNGALISALVTRYIVDIHQSVVSNSDGAVTDVIRCARYRGCRSEKKSEWEKQ